jgi:GNAT superfamily N-acetyltransferase
MSAATSFLTGPATQVVRVAQPTDAAVVAAAARSLLSELGAAAAGEIRVEGAFEAILERPGEATVLLAEEDDRPVGLLGASWPLALRTGGRYGLIQELWVRPDRRGAAIGALLIDTLVAHAGRRRISRIEVGLPREGFAGLEQTREFYARNGFESLGARMRRSLV